MKTVYTHNSCEWIDLLNPTDEELGSVVDQYKIDQSIIDDLKTPTLRHQVTFYNDHTYLVLHFPAFKDSSSDAAFELDFVVGEDFIITVHYSEVAALKEFAHKLTENAEIEILKNDRNTLFFNLLQSLLGDFEQKLVKVDHWVRDLEKNMFAGQEKQTIFELSEASRHLIDFKKITAVYPESFGELKDKGTELFGKEFKSNVEKFLETFDHDKVKLDMLSEAVKELRETNASILSTKQNETMKVLTAVTIVATVIVGIALFWVGWKAI